MTRRTRWAGLAALAPLSGLILALGSMPAEATAILKIDDGVNSITLSDGGTGNILYASLLDPSWSLAGGWIINLDWASTKPALGSAEYPDMHLAVGALGKGTLNVSFFDDGFQGSGLTNLNTYIGGVLGGRGSSFTAGSSSTDGALSSFGPFGSGAFSATDSAWQTLNGSYGLSLFATITNGSFDASSFDASIAVPEPGTFALFGASLLGCALVLRRRGSSASREVMAA